MARAGLVTRGVTHGLVGWLALRVAFGDRGERPDQHGALEAVVRQPFGRVLVLLLAVGFLGYALWRFIEAALDPEDKGTLKRIGCGARGILYLGFFGTALSFGLRGPRGAGDGNHEQDITARVLQLPGGQWIVVAAGLAVIAVGLWNGWRGISRKFEQDLKEYEMSDVERTWINRIAVVGLLARMVAYVLAGAFLVRAALRFDPRQAVGLDESLKELATKPFGPLLLSLVAVGLIAFGLFQLAMARYRRVLGS
jgi:hypothetical protein